MTMNWLKRSGLKKDAPTGADDAETQPSSTTAAPPEVTNDKATPVVGEERGIPSVNNRAFRSRAMPLTFGAIALAAIAIVWMIPSPQATGSKKSPSEERFDENKPSTVLAPLTPPQPPAPPQEVSFAPAQPTPLAAPPIQVIPAPNGGAPAAAGQRPPTRLELRQQSKILVVGDAGFGAAAAPAGPAPMAGNPGFVQTGAPALPGATGGGSLFGGAQGGGGGGGGLLGDALRPTPIVGTAASMLADRTFMLTQSNSLDCTLDFAISSAVPGMTKCTLTRSVWGEDRKVVLLERGTVLTGQYQGALQQGQARLFILWVRALTPKGVTINLASPGTDSLGRSGVDGFIDTHFWERFGAALFLSIIDDGLAIVAAKAQQSDRGGSDNNTVVLPQSTTQTSKNAATIAVENSIRIPPTLNKNQGEHVSVTVARDLDFRTVYALQATEARQ